MQILFGLIKKGKLLKSRINYRFFLPSSEKHFVSQFLFCCFKQHSKTFKAASFEEQYVLI